MFTGEIAKAQIEDRVRAADMARNARIARGQRVRGPRTVARSAGSGVLAAVVSLARMVAPAPRTRTTIV